MKRVTVLCYGIAMPVPDLLSCERYFPELNQASFFSYRVLPGIAFALLPFLNLPSICYSATVCRTALHHTLEEILPLQIQTNHK